jgi:glutathione S-transferase
MAGLPYRCDNRANVMRAPKRKLPWIDDDGTVVADSSFIVDHLKARYGDALDGRLAPLQQATALAFQRLFEENLYWAVLYTRWVDAAGWAVTRPAFFGTLSAPLAWIVPPLARSGIVKELRGHGMGRHTAAEIMQIGCRDLSAVAELLGNQPYMLGAEPSSLDATAYAFLANVLWVPVDSALQRHARSRPQLEAYCQRMKTRYYA